jgi:hypothetical protein
MILLRALICLSFLSTPLFSQWFWEKHYYEILSGGEKYYSEGKPRIEGEFTVFNKWPENLEWRVKTEGVELIKDIGPDSPEVLEGRATAARAKATAEQYNLLSIFKPLLSLNDENMLFSSGELKIARDRGYSDDEIWVILIKGNSAFSEARKSGFTLDRIAKFFDQEVDRVAK